MQSKKWQLGSENKYVSKQFNNKFKLSIKTGHDKSFKLAQLL